MPELPEVETIRQKLEPRLVGRRLDRVEINDPRLVRPFEPVAVAGELEGERVSALDRRGKYLIVRFESGRALLIHLRMTGSLRHAPKGELADDPLRPAGTLDDDELARLTQSIKDVLKAGVKRQGASLRDYSTPDGGRGRMQDRFRVYGREGHPCQRCGTPIDKIRTAGRGTWYCPNCQRLERHAASSSPKRPSRSRRHSSV